MLQIIIFIMISFRQQQQQLAQQQQSENVPMKLDEENDKVSQAITQYDKKFLKWLVSFHNALNREQISIDEIESLIVMVKHFYGESEDEYLRALFYPEISKGARVPSLFPVPSSAFQMHLQTSITTNTLGNVSFAWNPFYLDTGSGPVNSTFFLNRDVGLTGGAASNFYQATDIGYISGMIPNLYFQYRVVSAAVVVTYDGRLDIVSGIIGMGIGLQQFAAAQTVGGVDANLAQYGNFNLVDDLYFSQRTSAINGARALYFPIDNRYLEYSLLSTSKNGFYFVFYGQGLPASASCLRVDFYVNIESTVGPQYNNIIPQSCSKSTSFDAPKKVAEIIQQRPDLIVQTAGEAGKPKDGSWLSNIVGSAVSGGLKLLNTDIGSGLLSLIPGGGAIMKFLPSIAKMAGKIANI